MPLTVDLPRARGACRSSIAGFVDAVADLTELDLLEVSRCRGWTRMDVVVHVVGGWQEMLSGLVGVVDGPATVDAASYWPAFAAQEADEDPVRALMAQRRRTAAYLRPASAVEHLRDVAAALLLGLDHVGEGHHRWQGHVFTAGDFLTTWAVENAVHHLDLRLDTAPPTDALALVRMTVAALASGAVPQAWDDEQVALVGTGRVPVPDGASGLRLPVLG